MDGLDLWIRGWTQTVITIMFSICHLNFQARILCMYASLAVHKILNLFLCISTECVLVLDTFSVIFCGFFLLFYIIVHNLKIGIFDHFAKSHEFYVISIRQNPYLCDLYERNHIFVIYKRETIIFVIYTTETISLWSILEKPI